MPTIRKAARVVFAVVGVALLVAGPVVATSDRWGIQVGFTVGAAGLVALAIAAIGFREPRVGG